jgi:hypothetical protein
MPFSSVSHNLRQVPIPMIAIMGRSSNVQARRNDKGAKIVGLFWPFDRPRVSLLPYQMFFVSVLSDKVP